MKFTWRSGGRLRYLIRNCEDIWEAFVTLTYPADYPCNGSITKGHLNAFLQFLKRRGIKYAWVLEFQVRGAPHYHIIVSSVLPKEELSERWYEIVHSGDEKHLRAETGISATRSKEQLYGYLSRYIKKLDQKTPPAGFEDAGRFWGSSRSLLLFRVYTQASAYRKIVWHIKLLRNWYKKHLRKFGTKWRLKGKGFIALDGVCLINQLMSLRR